MPVAFIPALLRSMTGGLAEISVEGADVLEVIENLERAHPGVRERLMDGDRLRPSIQVAVDDAVAPRGLREPTPPGCEVHFVPAIRGGL